MDVTGNIDTKDPQDTNREVKKIYRNMLFFVPGNSFYRPGCIDLFIPFAKLKSRLHGCIYGVFISSLPDSNKFKYVNLPIIHQRAILGLDNNNQEYRTGIAVSKGEIDFTELFIMQILGEVLIETMYLLKKKFNEKISTSD